MLLIEFEQPDGSWRLASRNRPARPERWQRWRSRGPVVPFSVLIGRVRRLRDGRFESAVGFGDGTARADTSRSAVLSAISYMRGGSL